jgi:uncharacterized membrane protein
MPETHELHGDAVPIGRVHRRRHGVVLALAVIVSVTAPVATAFARQPQCGTPVPLRPLPGDTTSEAHAINAAGEVAGWSRGADHETAVVWDAHGTPRERAPVFGHHRSQAYAINASGEVAGDSHGAGPTAVMWDGAGNATVLLPLPGDTQSFARAINDAGQVVGFSLHRGTGGVVLRAVVWNPEDTLVEIPASIGLPPLRLPTALPLPAGVVEAAAVGINGNGQVAGFLVTDSADKAILWNPGATATPLPAVTAGETGSEAHAINAHGAIAGESSSADHDIGAVWTPGPRALRPLAGHSENLALAINDLGETAGRSIGPGGVTAVAWDAGGRPAALPPLAGHTESQAFAINAAGQVAGVSLGDTVHTAVVWSIQGCGRFGRLP